MVDGGNVAEIMYPDLFKGLKLKPEDLMPYNSPLMSFDGKLVTPKGMIRLPIQIGPEIVEVNFIVVDTYSPYMAIVGRPWLHTLGAVCLFLALEGEVPIRRSSPRDSRLPTHGKAVYGGGHHTSIQDGVLGPRGKRLIAIKSSGATA